MRVSCKASKILLTSGPVVPAAADKSVLLLIQLALCTIFAVYPAIGLAGDCNRIDAVEAYKTTGKAPEGSICETFLGLAKHSGVSCYWEFAFRSNEATRFFHDAWTEVTSCQHGDLNSGSNPVNHPDSYLQRELVTETGTYRVAMKDKGHEKRTLIFLSFENRD